MNVVDFIARLNNSRRKVFSGGVEGYICSCPTARHEHGDKSRSLAVFELEDRPFIKVKCQGGCTEQEILSAMGLSVTDLRVESRIPSSQPQAVYKYRKADGSEYFEKVRIPQGNGKKTFRLQAKLPSGKYSNNLQHLNGWVKTLYNLPEVAQAIKDGKPVYVNEGEKACDMMASKGLVSTCQPCGADERNPKSKWLDAHTKALQGADVIIVADRDAVGEAYARYVCSELKTCAKSVKIVQSAVDAPKADAYDHFFHGYTDEDFVPLAPLSAKKAFRTFEEIEEEEVDWLWKPYIPYGALTMLTGDPGIGKSTFSYVLASCVSNGKGGGGFPDMKPGKVLLYCLEDSSSKVIKKKLRQNEANFKNVIDGTYDPKDAPDGIEPPMTLEKMMLIKELAYDVDNLKLIVFDPIVEWFPPGKSMISGNESREVLKIFRQLSEDLGVAILILGHPNKQSGSSLMYRVSGSIDFSAIVRSGMYASKIPDTEDCAIFHFKANWGARGKPIGYKIDDAGRFFFNGFIDGDESMLKDGFGPSTKQINSCGTWLLEALKDGPVPSAELIELAKQNGHSRASLFRAREGLGITTEKVGKSFVWRIEDKPTRYWTDQEDPFEKPY